MNYLVAIIKLIVEIVSLAQAVKLDVGNHVCFNWFWQCSCIVLAGLS